MCQNPNHYQLPHSAWSPLAHSLAAKAGQLSSCLLQVHPNGPCHPEVAYGVPVKDEVSDPTGLRPCPLRFLLSLCHWEALAQVGWGPTGDNDRFRK